MKRSINNYNKYEYEKNNKDFNSAVNQINNAISHILQNYISDGFGNVHHYINYSTGVTFHFSDEISSTAWASETDLKVSSCTQSLDHWTK